MSELHIAYGSKMSLADPSEVAAHSSQEEPIKDQTVALERIYRELGNPGKYVVFQYIVYCLSVSSVAFSAINFVFIGYETPHQCARMDEATERWWQDNLALTNSTSHFVYHECSIQLLDDNNTVRHTWPSCIAGHDFFGKKHISYVSEWEFVCENKSGLVAFTQTALMIGQGIGAVFTTILADKYGRKPIVMASCLSLVLVGVGGAYSPNIYVLIVAKFLTGIVQQGAGLVAFTLVMEGVMPHHRRYGGVLGGVNWNFTMCLMALTAWLMADMSWRSFQLVTGLTAAVVVIQPWFLAESSRWLVANQKYDQALAVLKTACKMNAVDYDRIKKLFNETVRNFGTELEPLKPDKSGHTTNRNDDVMTETEPDKKYTVLDILRHSVLLKPTLTVLFTWMTCSITYYGLLLASSSLSGDRHLNFFIMSAVDFIGDVIIFTLLDRIGRRYLAMLALGMTGTGLMAASFLMAYGTSALTGYLTTVFFILGKLGIGICFSSIFIFTPELYPTNLRTAGMGLCSSMGRIGGMLAPYSIYLTDVVQWGPGAVFSGMCLLSAILLVRLPETKGRSLPTTIEDMKTWSATDKKHSDVVKRKSTSK